MATKLRQQCGGPHESGTVEANRPKVSEHGHRYVLLQHDREVAEAYQVSGTPSAVLIRRDGTIDSAVVPGADAIRALLDQALTLSGLDTLPVLVAADGNGQRAMTASRPPARPKRGESAPDFSLPDLSGQTVHLSEKPSYEACAIC